jgi:hypothetical protein
LNSVAARPGDGVECPEWLVHQQQRRVGGEGACHADALALAARKLVRAAPGEAVGVEPDEGQQFLHAGGDASGRPAFEPGTEADVLLDGEMGEQPDVLNHVPDPAPQAVRSAARSFDRRRESRLPLARAGG